jgi:transposase
MRRTFASIANCSSPTLGRRLRRPTVDWESCRRFEPASSEWKNRKNSGMIDAVAQSLADVTISHFTSQLGAIDKAITQTIDNDPILRRKRDLLLSISGVGETLAAAVLAELPGPDVLRSGAEVVAYTDLNPRLHQSGTSIDRMTRISKIGNAVLRAALTCRPCRPCDIILRSSPWWRG